MGDFMKDKQKNKSKKYNENDKATMDANVEIGSMESDTNDFVPNAHQWTSSSEQKTKAKEIQNKTKR